MSEDRWRDGVQWRDHRPDGNVRHSQVLSTFGPGALVDLVDDAVIVSGLTWWAKGRLITEDRLVTMLRMVQGFETVRLYEPPPAPKNPDDPARKWIKAFRFPEWFICQNEDCWEETFGSKRKDETKPRRMLYMRQDSERGHKCSSKGKASPVQPLRFVRACSRGHVDDVDWAEFVHRSKPDCTRKQLWYEETGATGDLGDIRLFCLTCSASQRMSAAKTKYLEGALTLGKCGGRRPWIGSDKYEECDEHMRLLARSASNAYFPVAASVIHIPDPDGILRDKVEEVFDLLKLVKKPDQVALLREMQEPLQKALAGLSDEAVFAEVVRRREKKPVVRKKVKEAEFELLQNCPPELSTDQPGSRFYARTLKLPKKRPKLIAAVDKVVLVLRLTEVRALAGFTRFEPKSTDLDGELDIGAEVARLDEPLTWLPTVENHGEGFFFSLKESALQEWEQRPAVQARQELIKGGFDRWKAEREDRSEVKPDFATTRYVMLHSLSHLLITAVSLECGYAASSIRERLYASPGGTGLLLYTASSGAEGSLGGLVEVGRHLDRYLEDALELGKLCSNDPVCAAHVASSEVGVSDRHLEGASCHGCLLISEPSCERMNTYLDRTLVVPTVENTDAAFFRGR